MISGEAVFRLRGDVRFRRVPPEGVVVRQTDPEVLVVNDLGARVLEALDGAHPVSSLLRTFAAEYDVEEGRLEEDVKAFLDELLAGRIIESVDGR